MTTNNNSTPRRQTINVSRGNRKGYRGKGNRFQQQELPASVIMDRKTRRVGTDDLMEAAQYLKYAEEAGFRGRDLEVASAMVIGLETAVACSLKGEHKEAAKKAASCMYVCKRNERIAKIEIVCRDNRKRHLGDVTVYSKVQPGILSWFSAIHFKVAAEIEAAKLEEDQRELAAEVELLEAAKEMAETKKRNAELSAKATEVIAAAATADVKAA